MKQYEQAQQGLHLLEQAIMDYLRQHPNGVSNAEIANALGLQSDFEGSQKNYLSWSVLGLLVNGGEVEYRTEYPGKRYYLKNQ